MTLSDVRRFGLQLPATTEEPHHDMGSLRVKGKIFVTWPADGSRVHIFVSEPRARELAAANPTQCEVLTWGAKVAGLRVALPALDGAALQGWIGEAWAAKAPTRLVKLRGAG